MEISILTFIIINKGTGNDHKTRVQKERLLNIELLIRSLSPTESATKLLN